MRTYTVYDRKTDWPVFVGGSAKECAAAMGITVASFYTIFTKLKNGHRFATKKWDITVDDEDDECE